MKQEMNTAVAETLGLLLMSVGALTLLWTVLIPYRTGSAVSTGVLIWWSALCAISVLNFCAWRLSAVAIERQKPQLDPALYVFQRRQLLLSAVYVLGCGFRAILPRADVQRIGLFDSWLSSVLVGRSVATLAELCFVAQCALLLNRISKEADSRFGIVVSWLLVPIIVVAEICSWYAVLTTSYMGNTIEESLWTFSGLLLVFSLLRIWPRSKAYRPLVAVALVLGVAYVTFMFTVDVPMYLSRWLHDEATGRQYLSLQQGLSDVWSRWVITHDWEAWRTEMPWMSLYFSVGVWCSIALVHAPRIASPDSSFARNSEGMPGEMLPATNEMSR
jgi:hypothetical protein